MKIYIAGRIAGDKNYERKFEKATQTIRESVSGYVSILNPCILPKGMSSGDYMRICLSMIDAADEVCFLPDWGMSNGATIERMYCEYTGKTIRDLRFYE